MADPGKLYESWDSPLKPTERMNEIRKPFGSRRGPLTFTMRTLLVPIYYDEFRARLSKYLARIHSDYQGQMEQCSLNQRLVRSRTINIRWIGLNTFVLNGSPSPVLRGFSADLTPVIRVLYSQVRGSTFHPVPRWWQFFFSNITPKKLCLPISRMK